MRSKLLISKLGVNPVVFWRQQTAAYGSSSSSAVGMQVDPFDAQEARPYKQDPEVLAMTNLVAAYQGNNIREFEKILATNRSACCCGCG